MSTLNPPKNWKLKEIKKGIAKCAACNANLKNLFVMSHAEVAGTATVGSELASQAAIGNSAKARGTQLGPRGTR